MLTRRKPSFHLFRHQHEQDCLLARMKSLVDSFDVYLSALVDERRKVSVELKYAELTMICLYEEQMIIQDTQETEDRLDRSVRQLERNLAEIDAKVSVLIGHRQFLIQYSHR